MLNTIYKITNQINKKVYIGKTSLTIEERFRQHKKDANKDRNEKRPLYDAFNKYGIENFVIEEIETNIPDEEINDKEIYYIKKYNSYVGFQDSNGYNATLGGDSKKYKEYNIEDIIKKYQECCSLKEVERIFNLDRSYIRRLLQANNVPILTLEERNKKLNKDLGHSVVQIDLNKNIILNTFLSKADASEFMGKKRTNGSISDACQARRGHHRAYGYRWYWKEDWDNYICRDATTGTGSVLKTDDLA